jgi:hypothetical protein
MSEDAIVILMMLFWATVAYAAYLRVFLVRGLRKKLDKITEATLAARAAEPSTRPVGLEDQQRELQRIQERLRVLERIAVEKEDSLTREIEDLRQVGA